MLVRVSIRRFFRTAAVLFLCVVAVSLTACGWMRPGVEGPVGTFMVPPSTPGELAKQLRARQGEEIEDLRSTLQVEGSRRWVPGKQKWRLSLLYGEPGRVVLQAERPGVGGLMRVVQDGDAVMVHLQKAGEFYTGTGAQLRQSPELLFAIEPLDLAQALLPGQVLANYLDSTDGPEDLPDPTGWGRLWRFRWTLEDGRQVTCEANRSDGLIREIVIEEPGTDEQARVRYRVYERYEGILLPSRLELRLPGGIRVEVVTERMTPNRRNLRDAYFSTTPPRGLPAWPLERLH